MIFKNWLIAQLRRLHYKWPSQSNAKKIARVSRGIYQCALCNSMLGNKETRIDHISPVVDPGKGFEGWDTYIKRLFVTTGEYQILCVECHKNKTLEENKKRLDSKNKSVIL